MNDLAVSSHGDSSVQPHERARLINNSCLGWHSKRWHVRAFTQANGLARNLQTRLICQCAKELLVYSCSGVEKWKRKNRLRAAQLSSLELKPKEESCNLVSLRSSCDDEKAILVSCHREYCYPWLAPTSAASAVRRAALCAASIPWRVILCAVSTPWRVIDWAVSTACW